MKLNIIVLLLFFIVITGWPAFLFAETCTEGNCIDGKGTLSYADGGSYEGEFSAVGVKRVSGSKEGQVFNLGILIKDQ